MRFCLVSTQQHWGGGEALLFGIANELQLAGHAVSWVARSGSEVLERLSQNAAHVLHATQGRGFNPGDWWATRRAFRNWVPDILLLNDTHAVPLGGSAAWFCRSPRPLRLAYKHTVFPLRSRLKYRWLSDKLVCVSEAARRTVCRGGLSESRTAVIHGGCKLPVVRPDARRRIRAELQIAEDEQLLVCVGNLLPCKGHADLLHAVGELQTASQPSANGIRLVIAGQGEQCQALKEQIAKLSLSSSVHLLGYRTDAEELLSAADLVVHPSHAEGLSLVLIQAQMLGMPIVATPVGGAVEVLRSDRSEWRSCWLAEPNNPTSLAQAIHAALAELRDPSPEWKSRLEQTTEWTQGKFRIDRIAQQLTQLAAELQVGRSPGTQK